MDFLLNLKDILKLTTAQDITDWNSESKVVTDIAADPITGNARVAVIGNMYPDFNARRLSYHVVVYNIKQNGDPINGRESMADGNIFPKEVMIIADNNSFVSMTPPFAIIPPQDVTEDMMNNVDYGIAYMREYDLYRYMAKSGDINIFQLMENGIKTSSKI